ncbi:DUF1801 domain-containing protein [Pseudooceanicola sp.]|uniref:DUF1801 domain-containing protein n=1 Tax=Pseudooceanicola sp. TaxID=1914328 RepID=UPI0035C6B5B9
MTDTAQTLPPPPDAVVQVLAALPVAQAARLRELRTLILRTAAETEGVGPLTETLKWGEPAYLTEASRSGSTLRIGPVRGRTDQVALFVNCRTTLADTFRARFGPSLRIEGDRALPLDVTGPLDEDVLRECIALTLTYHRWRNGG